MTDTSTVERFRPYAIYDGGVRSGMEPCDFGGWVRYDDYAILIAELDALQAKMNVAVEMLGLAQESIASFIGVHGYPMDSGAGDILDQVSNTLAQITKENKK